MMTPASTLELAKERHLAGDLAAARALYERVLENDPNNAAVLFRIGVLEIQGARFAAALEWIDRAIAIAPTEPRHYLGRGQVLSELKRFAEAAAAYRKVLELGPESADLHFSLGLALQSAGDAGGAISAYRSALSLQPHFASALTNLAVALQAMGEDAAAIEASIAATQIEPAVALHQVSLGSIFCQQRKFADGAAMLRRAIALDPNSAEAAYNLGIALNGLGQLREAVAAYQSAVTLAPGYADAWNNLGAVYKELGDFKGAASAFDTAAQARPDFIAAYNNSACLLRTLGRMDEAEIVLRKAIARGLKSAAIYNNLGSVLKDAGALDEAIESYRQAMRLDPGDAELHGNLAYSLSFQKTDGQSILAECKRWNALHAAPLSVGLTPHQKTPIAGRRIRVGYVSGDFRDHCQSLFTIPLLSHHDRKAFEIYCYASVERPDDYTRRIAGYVDHFRDVRTLNDLELAQCIRKDGIDILVDLGMHMSASRPLVFARAPAPVQVAWLAYPGTTGIDAISYRLTDPRLDPAGFDDQYTEQSIRLPDTFWCYDPLSDQTVNELPALERGFVTFGCLNNPCKLTDQTLSIWAGVMGAMPTARLVLMAPPGRPRQRLSERLTAHGIATEHVSFERFQPRAEYLRAYHGIDLGLDTFPYNGHTTSLDSLWMGVPVVTRIGQTAVGRGGLSQLFNLGLTELAAESDEQFVEIAVKLAADLPRLASLRRGLRSRMERSPLMNGERFAKNVEAAYRELLAKWQS